LLHFKYIRFDSNFLLGNKYFVTSTSTSTSTSTEGSSTSTKYQYFACKYQYQYQYSKNVLKYNLSTSTSTKYNKTAYYFCARSGNKLYYLLYEDLKNRIITWHYGWWHSTVVERRYFAGELSPFYAWFAAGWPLSVGKPSAAVQPTRPTQPFILLGVDKWVAKLFSVFSYEFYLALVVPSGKCLRGKGPPDRIVGKNLAPSDCFWQPTPSRLHLSSGYSLLVVAAVLRDSLCVVSLLPCVVCGRLLYVVYRM